jgi:hypothetical protein
MVRATDSIFKRTHKRNPPQRFRNRFYISILQVSGKDLKKLYPQAELLACSELTLLRDSAEQKSLHFLFTEDGKVECPNNRESMACLHHMFEMLSMKFEAFS